MAEHLSLKKDPKVKDLYQKYLLRYEHEYGAYGIEAIEVESTEDLQPTTGSSPQQVN